MFDITNLGFWSHIRDHIMDVLLHPGREIQLFFSAIAITVALLASLLSQRILIRKYPPGSKHYLIAGNILPALLTPLLMIITLLIAAWLSILVVDIHQHTIAAFVKLAMVWFLARVLLLLAHRHFMAYFISSVMLVVALLSVTDLLAPTQASLNEITFESSTFHLSLLGAIKGIFSLVVLFWGAGVLGSTGENWIRRLHLTFNARELAIKFLRIALYFFAFVFTLNQMGVDLTALTVFGGALAVGLGFGLQKITSNFISGIILLFEKTIQAGDLISVGGEKGWVRQMAIRHTLIETSDGRELLIPNEDLITSKVTSWTYTNSHARAEIIISVEFGTDAELVRKLLIDLVHSYPHSLTDPAPACYLREFSDHGLQFQLVFWIPDIKTGMSAARSDVMYTIVKSFRENNIRFAKA